MTTPDHIRAHRHCTHHRDEILSSGECGCFYCGAIFLPGAIMDWTDVGVKYPDGGTALCPKCGIDAVIGSASGYPVTEEFLKTMTAHWF